MKIESILSFETNYAFKHFDCGDESLNKYLKTFAYLNDTNNLSKTFIAHDGDTIIGFVTLCNAQIEFKEMPDDYQKEMPDDYQKEMPKYPVPAVKIARLAVDTKYQSKGYGKELLLFTFKKIIQVSLSIGVKAVIVDAKEQSKMFYEKYGFIKIIGNTYIMLIDTLIDGLL